MKSARRGEYEARAVEAGMHSSAGTGALTHSGVDGDEGHDLQKPQRQGDEDDVRHVGELWCVAYIHQDYSQEGRNVCGRGDYEDSNSAAAPKLLDVSFNLG